MSAPSGSAATSGLSRGWCDVSHEAQTARPSATQSNMDKHSFEAIVARIDGLRDPQDELKLTPLRAHYLKKALVKLQVQKEVLLLSRPDALSTLGPPFRPSAQARTTDLPIMRYLFHHFVLTFPFLRSAPPNFFADKVQVFFDRFLERNISGSDDREETSKRRKIGNKIEKYIVLLFGSAVHVKPDGADGKAGEEVIRIAEADRKRIAEAELRMKAVAAGNRRSGQFDVDVVSVRAITMKGRLRSKIHEEFIIRSRTTVDNKRTDVFVSRRYGDFVRLADTLRLEFPDEDIRPPPTKDRSKVEFRQRSLNASPMAPASVNSSNAASPAMNMVDLGASQAPAPVQVSDNMPIAREKNRLTLRAYLQSLLAVPALADSRMMEDFLTRDPTSLTEEERKDAALRQELDAVREEEAARFAEESNKRVAALQEHLAKFKTDLIRSDGLSRIFGTIKATPSMYDLPQEYLALIAWARISTASTLFHMFMGSDTSSELFARLKRVHGLMPYFMMRGILRISNPIAMIRGGLDLFLAQPFGKKSLIQRMFSSGLQEDVKELSGLCAAVEEKVADELLCSKVYAFIELPQELQSRLRKTAADERLDLITVILRSVECGEQLHAVQIDRVVRASRSYEVYKAYRAGLAEDEEDEGPQSEDAWLYEDLHVLLRCGTRLRDKEQMIELIFEGVTADLLKDIITIFYSPLAQVYKAANISDSLVDLQSFIDDLIRTIETHEELSYTNPQATVQVFIDLVARHEARFYNFVHQVHSKGSGLFDGLMHWIELFINFVRGSGTSANVGERRGIGAVDLDICLPAGAEARKKAMDEIDLLVVYAYRQKLLREIKLRRRLAEKEVEAAADRLLNKGPRASAGLGSDAAFVEAVVDNLGIGDMFTGEMEDVEAEVEDEDEEDEDERAESITPRHRHNSDSDLGHGAHGSGWAPRVHSGDEEPSGSSSARKQTSLSAKPVPPELVLIPEMLPTFIEMVRPLLRPARTANGTVQRGNSYDFFLNADTSIPLLDAQMQNAHLG
ncbi:hypothetical protein K437DRAFT_254863 [Tilletiaria anomala UBC 951]|uniref:PX domain-containing protein n=1 Tax=Tilletiaria anomala (strain ATCC 24038 / CBS 436.72 / UBC 951) TaxID=1037660 RepID=A0A066WFZ5_TILAU|nr:uncharacterized protein K437DRAFT_254863 [Tilletiaria anomala UBC 951]KDN51443.1 hypothetical protein K437DRAFT_254863 [Tilletiaria anomala UBC 951]